MQVFSRYNPAIQRYIYSSGWQSLRAIQAAAGEAIFGTEANVLLSASTASGKTEAAFFPIITLLQEQPSASIGCLYIAPLKALINDQFSRLNDICEEMELPVWHWHGDVSQSQKKKLMKHPSGILQITPESLEAMLLHRHSLIPHLFGDLRFVVIDEIHSFLRGDRGGQTLCLLERLSRLAGVNPRRVGLSATIGDLQMVGRYLSAGTGRGTVIPRIDDSGKTRWRISMEHFFSANSANNADNANNINGGPVPQGNVSICEESTISLRAETERILRNADNQPSDFPTAQPIIGTIGINDLPLDPGLAYIYRNTQGHKCLVFSNSREECEVVTATLRQYCEALRQPDRFLIHHGNLSQSLRESAEEDMKQDGNLITICTTSTLELGIDVGRLERAFQIDAPFTVSSFLQRMGRTGRRGLPSEMWFVIREEPAEARALLPATIPWKMLQGIALIQLYMEERWVEPPRTGRLPYSLLYHQTMATLASGGEMMPAELAGRVLTLSYFKGISQDDFRILLRHLLENDHIQLTERGGIIVGLKGERVVNNFKFYAVFQENVEYSVRCDSQELGTICKPPPMGEKIAIAGRVWVVDEVDHQRHIVYCQMVKGIVPAYFGDEPGDIHTHILERMQRVLREDTVYAYLLPHARERLAHARHAAKVSGLGLRWLMPLGGQMYSLTPWLGSYAFLALERFLKLRCASRLKLKGFDSQRPYYMQFTLGVSEGDFYRILAEEIEQPFDPMDLLYPKEAPIFDKYDDLLPVALTRKGFAYGVLGVEEMKGRVRQMCSWANEIAKLQEK